MADIVIPLTKGRFAVIDEEDAELAAHKWQARFRKGFDLVYAARQKIVDGRKVSVLLHREVMGFGPGDPMIDHKDGDGLNCRRSNLRASNHTENARNHPGPYRNNVTSGVKGVYQSKGCRSFKAAIFVNGKHVHLGSYKTIPEAAEARRIGEIKHFGIQPQRAKALGDQT